MAKPPFEKVWSRILALEGEEFQTITGLNFTYRIRGNSLIPSRTNYSLHKSDFDRAYQLVPLKGPGIINNLVRGPAYIWAILHDYRISLDDW